MCISLVCSSFNYENARSKKQNVILSTQQGVVSYWYARWQWVQKKICRYLKVKVYLSLSQGSCFDRVDKTLKPLDSSTLIHLSQNFNVNIMHIQWQLVYSTLLWNILCKCWSTDIIAAYGKYQWSHWNCSGLYSKNINTKVASKHWWLCHGLGG